MPKAATRRPAKGRPRLARAYQPGAGRASHHARAGRSDGRRRRSRHLAEDGRGGDRQQSTGRTATELGPRHAVICGKCGRLDDSAGGGNGSLRATGIGSGVDHIARRQRTARIHRQQLALLDPSAADGRRCAAAARARRCATGWRCRRARSSRRQSPAGIRLYDGLGKIHFPITTSSPEAQRYFNQGMGFAYGFNHAAAIASFKEAQRLDPDCAMCWWGESLAYGPNINAPLTPDANTLALKAIAAGAAAVGQGHAARAGADHGAGQALFGRPQCQARRSRRRLCRCDADGRPLLSAARRHLAARRRSGDGHAAVGLLGARQAERQAAARRSDPPGRNGAGPQSPTIRRRRTSTST